MSQGAVAKELPRRLTPPAMALYVVMGALLGLLSVIVTPFTTGWAGFLSADLILFIVLLLALQTRLAFSSQTLVYIFASSAMGLMFCRNFVPYGIIHNSAAARLFQYNWHPTNWAIRGYWVFGPIISDPAEMTPIQVGGPVPWGQWTPFLAWWITYTVLWVLFFTAWIALLQERWMIVERLPFPPAIPVMVQIELAAKKGKDPRLRYFLLGLLVGFLVILPWAANQVYPAIPDIYGWTREPFIPWWLGAIDFSRTPLGPIIIPWSVLPLNPQNYVVWYLMPTKISFTVWFTQLFIVTIPSQIAFYMGYYSDLPTMANRFHAFMNGAPFRWNGWFIGSAYGLLALWFILSWKYLKEVFLGARRTMPGKLGVAIITGSTIALFAALVAAGVSMAAAALIILTQWLIYVGAVRQMGLSYITAVPSDWTHLPTLVKYLYIPDPGYVTIDGANARPPQMVIDLWFANRPTGVLIGYMGYHGALAVSYKVAYDSGVDLWDLTKLILVTATISAVIGYTVGLWFSYAVGTNNTRMGMFDAWWHWVFGAPWARVEEQFITEPLPQYIVAGFILIALISYLNFRFVWWPLDPVGIVVGLGGGFATAYILPAFFGWLARRLVYRIGGAKMDEQVAIPFVVGFLVGYSVTQAIATLITTVQFYLPK
ncbi:MAG: DUF6785 family protein [Thermofilaceae archaeon]